MSPAPRRRSRTLLPLVALALVIMWTTVANARLEVADKFCPTPHGDPCDWDIEPVITGKRLAWRWEWLPDTATGSFALAHGGEPFGIEFGIELPCVTPPWLGLSWSHGCRGPRTDPADQIVVALHRDIEGMSRNSVARELFGEHYADGGKRVTRYHVAARQHLHDAGVLPWAAWPEGRLPARWWRHFEFAQAISRWAWR